MKLRVNRKKIGAWLLVICLLTGLVSGFPVKESRASSPSNYKELTFSDWGIVNGAYNNGETYTLTDTNITSLDGVAFTGKITFNGANDFRIGGGGWAGLTGLFGGSTLYLSDQTGGGNEYPVEGVTLSKTTAFKLRLTFEQDTENNKWFVGVWINDTFVNQFTYSGMTLGRDLLINGSGMTLEDVDFIADYKELTFSNWGIVNGAYNNGETYTLTDTDITSLDGAAFTGRFTFNGANDFRIGGGGWAGLTGFFSGSTLYLSDQTGGGNEYPMEGITLSKTTAFKLRLTFDQSTTNNKWLVGVWVNDAFVNEYVYSGMTLGKDFLINGSGMTLEDVQVGAGTPDTPDTPDTPNVPDTTRLYKELTVSDWGITDSSYINGEGYTLTDTSITSLDGTAFHAKLTYNSAADLRIGGEDNPWAGLVVFFSGSTLYLSDQTGGGNEYGVQGVTLSKAEEFILRLTFDQDAENNAWKVGVWVNNVYVEQYTYAGMNPGTKLMINGADMHLEDVSYNNLTVSDWGIIDGSYINGNGYSLTDTNITSLDGTAFNATLTYNNAADLRIGGGDNAWAGLTVYISSSTLYLSDQIGGGNEHSVSGVTLSKAEPFKLRLTFDQDSANNKWYVGVWINDIYADTFTYTDMTLGTHFLVNGDGMVLADVQTEPDIPDNPDEPDNPDTPDEPEGPDTSITYIEKTLSDWGIMDGEYIAGQGYILKDGTSSLEGIALNMCIENGNSIGFRLGGSDNAWAGILFQAKEEGLMVASQISGYEEGGFILPYTAKNLSVDKFTLRLTFDIDLNNDVRLGIWIDDTFQKYLNYEGMGQAMGTSLLFDAAGIILEDVGGNGDKEDSDGKAETLPKNFREVTFKSFGIKDQTYEYAKDNMAAEGLYMLQLDKTIFSGDICFSKDKIVDLRYGGLTSQWYGLIFTNTEDGKLYLQGIADNKEVTDTYIFNPQKAGTTLVGDWFNLKLTTEILDTDKDGKKDDVRLGVWFNNVLYNNQYIDLQDYAQHLGSNCGVYVRDNGGFVKIRSDKNVYVGVDFTLFGFTRNWAKELGIL